MTIASEIQNYANGLGDAYDAVDDMGGVIPQDKNMNNLDTAIRTIPQNPGITYTAGEGINIDANAEISTSPTIFYEGSNMDDTTPDFFYKDSAQTQAVTEAEFLSAINAGSAWVCVDTGGDSEKYPLCIVRDEDGTGYEAGDELFFWTQTPVDFYRYTPYRVGGVFKFRKQSDSGHPTFTGATSLVAGEAGFVPAPTTSDPDKFLKGDGTWGTPTDTTYSAGTNVQISAGNVISATDTTYSAFTGATSGAAGTAGLVPAPAAGDQNKVLKGDGTWADDSTELVEMAYGESSAWAKFIAAYNAKKIVYCRASSNANPGSGAKTRKAFMAYVNNESNPTSVEFQYVRSVGSKTSSQPVDQVFVYTLTNANGGTWSVVTRDMAPKLAAGTNISVSYSSGTYTVSATDTTYSNMTGATSGTAGTAGLAPAPAAGDQDKVLTGAGTWDTRAKITMTSTDPGSGSALSADNYVAVYGNSDGQITSTDLANNSVATANLQDYSVTRVKLNHLDLVNNGEWVCIGYAYLGATTDSTVAVTVDIPADYQGQKMQYKIVGAYECPSVNGSTKYTRVEVKIGGVWKTSNVFGSYQGVVNGGNWVWYGASGSQGYSGTAAWFGHEWTTASDWDSCAFEFIASSCYPGSHWAFSGSAGGMSGGHPGTLNYGGRVQDGNAIQAFRLACSASVKWGQGAGFAVYARRKNF